MDLRNIFDEISKSEDADYIVKKVNGEYYLEKIPLLDDLLENNGEKEDIKNTKKSY